MLKIQRSEQNKKIHIHTSEVSPGEWQHNNSMSNFLHPPQQTDMYPHLLPTGTLDENWNLHMGLMNILTVFRKTSADLIFHK